MEEVTEFELPQSFFHLISIFLTSHSKDLKKERSNNWSLEPIQRRQKQTIIFLTRMYVKQMLINLLEELTLDIRSKAACSIS